MLIYLVIAAIFWFNPLVSNVDILPDVIGYLLVMKAFSKCSYIYDYADDVCVSAKKMCIITGVKFFTIFIVSSLDPSMLLLLSFSFGVVEIIFGLPFFSNLFYMFSKMVDDGDGKTYAKSLGSAKNFAITYFVAKLALAFMPDLTVLTIDYSLGNVEFSYLRFRPLLIAFSVFVCTIIGIVWLVSYLRYLKRVITKKAVSIIALDFEKGLENKKAIFVAKDSIRMAMITAFASIFILDFKIGYTNVDAFQDFLFTLIAALGVLYLLFKGVCKLNKSIFVLTGALAIHIGANLFENNANKAYFEKYNYASVFKVSEAEDMYITVCVGGLISAIALILATGVILLIMRNNARANIINNAHLFTHSDIDYYLNEFNKQTGKNIAFTMLFAVLSGISYVLLVLLRPSVEWMILVNFVCDIIYIISFISSTVYISDEVYKRILSFV